MRRISGWQQLLLAFVCVMAYDIGKLHDPYSALHCTVYTDRVAFCAHMHSRHFQQPANQQEARFFILIMASPRRSMRAGMP